MTATTVSQAVAQRDNTPTALVTQYAADFGRVLPSHIKPDTWVRLTQGALKKGKRIAVRNDPNFGKFELEVAAANNPGVFLASLLDAARLGLTPGSEEYYLTPRKVQGRLEILGIVGYQGYVELMYRAGAIASVVVQVVRANDEYRYQRGVDEVPIHRFRPFARDVERGELIGVYAYARMKDGAVSQVVELNIDDIERIKASSQGAKSDYSPWVNHEVAMWMKSAARQLRKWVPTSAEYRTVQAAADLRARDMADEHSIPSAPSDGPDVLDGEVLDGDSWPDVAEPPAGDE